MNPPALVAFAPAKINLVLRVVDRRPDGYHELDTVFQAIDLWDRLEIRQAPVLTLDGQSPGLALDETNLVLRAARLLAERHGPGRDLGAALTLSKRIPSRAGLGGGSSDAAATLELCNRFWDLKLELLELEPLGAELGADVPFFLTGGTARGTGRGDRIEPLPFIGELPILLGHPPFGIDTAEVYTRLSGRLTLPGNGVSVSILSALKSPEGNDFRFLANDLAAGVEEDWPELKNFQNTLLSAGARAALLSGSGSTVFGVFPGESELAKAARRLRTAYPE